MEEARKTELPPLYEPLVLNCDLLFALANELKIDNSEKTVINKILQTEKDRLEIVSELAKGKDSELFTSADFTNSVDILEQWAGATIDEAQFYKFNEDGTLNLAEI